MNIKIKYEHFYITFKALNDIIVKDLIMSLKNNNSLNIKNQQIILIDESQKILGSEDIIKVINSNNISNTDKKADDPKYEFKSNEDSVLNEKLLYLHTFKKIGTSHPKCSSIENFFSQETIRDIPNSTKNNQSKIEELRDLIMKTTNAKEKIDTSSIRIISERGTDRFRMLEDIFNMNLAGVIEQPLQAGERDDQNTRIQGLLNIIRPMIQNDIGDSNHFTITFSNDNQARGNRSIHTQNQVIPDENLLNNLKEMGFSEEQGRRALIASRNDITRATDLLLSDTLDYIPNDFAPQYNDGYNNQAMEQEEEISNNNNNPENVGNIDMNIRMNENSSNNSNFDDEMNNNNNDENDETYQSEIVMCEESSENNSNNINLNIDSTASNNENQNSNSNNNNNLNPNTHNDYCQNN